MKKGIEEDLEEEYWNGSKNFFIRIYFYCLRGSDVVNNFRNTIIMIGLIYIALKLNNLWILPLIFIPSLFFLCVAGWYQTHHMGKVIDWLNVRYSTHYSKYSYELMENQLKKLGEILEEIKNLKEDKNNV